MLSISLPYLSTDFIALVIKIIATTTQRTHTHNKDTNSNAFGALLMLIYCRLGSSLATRLVRLKCSVINATIYHIIWSCHEPRPHACSCGQDCDLCCPFVNNIEGSFALICSIGLIQSNQLRLMLVVIYNFYIYSHMYNCHMEQDIRDKVALCFIENVLKT